MSTFKFLTACVFVAVAGEVAPAQPGEKSLILDTFQGTVAKDQRPELKTGWIATEADWKEVRAKFNPKEKLPAVDFTKHFLLVATHDAADPNRRAPTVLKDDKGVVTLSVKFPERRLGFTASDRIVYTFYKVSREGVTGVLRPTGVFDKTLVEPLPK
jgi:hypothetical protein